MKWRITNSKCPECRRGFYKEDLLTVTRISDLVTAYNRFAGEEEETIIVDEPSRNIQQVRENPDDELVDEEITIIGEIRRNVQQEQENPEQDDDDIIFIGEIPRVAVEEIPQVAQQERELQELRLEELRELRLQVVRQVITEWGQQETMEHQSSHHEQPIQLDEFEPIYGGNTIPNEDELFEPVCEITHVL